MCILRGKPVVDDFSKYYSVNDDGTTGLNLLLKVRNRKEKKCDMVSIFVKGHVPTATEENPYLKDGGMAEQMLKRLSSKCDITIYCHATYDVNAHNQYLICDSYRTESRTSRMQAIKEETEKKKALEQKYINSQKGDS